MPARETKSILVRMSPTLKRRLGREVARGEGTLNDIAAGILAERYGIDFEPSGRKGNPPSDSGSVLLRVPPAIKQRLHEDARERGISTNQLIVEALSERLLTRKEPMAQQNG